MGIEILLLAALPLAPQMDGTVSVSEASAVVEGADSGDIVETRVAVPRHSTTLALRDLTGDGRMELLSFSPRGVLVRKLRDTGAYDEIGALRQWPSTSVGWDLADLDGDGRDELLYVADGRTFVRQGFDAENGFEAPQELVETGTYLPAGIARVPFARDIDEDGRLDLVLPGPGRFHLRLNRGPDRDDATRVAWSTPVEVDYEPAINYSLGDPQRLSSTFGQRVRVPWFQMKDVDGDGRPDLVSTTLDRVAFHLARPEIDALPSWELDLSALKNDVSASDIDLDNLLGAVSGFAQYRTEDLDGVPPNDLIIGSEGTFKVYLGGAATGPVAKPDQVLKASGNVLYFFVRDVLGDDLPDLQIARGERISLAQLLKYLVVPGQLDFDVFTYENEGGTFASRPTKRTTLAVRVPRLFSLMKDFDEVADELEAQWDIPARRLDWNGDGRENDIVDVEGGVLKIFENCAPEEQRFENLSLLNGSDAFIEQVWLQDLDRLDDGGESVIDLGEIEAFAISPGKVLRDATRGREPSVTVPVWNGKDDRESRAIDLDGDGLLDLVTVVDGDEGLQVQFLVRRGR
ncbi:MAG: VCBS repeat-containing protein [Planctomycetota bacterium]